MTSNSSMFHCFLLLELFSFFVVKMADMDSLLGSRISLISLQDVRYDGVLYSINQKESSIVLRDGKMFYRWIAIEGVFPCICTFATERQIASSSCNLSNFLLLLFLHVPDLKYISVELFFIIIFYTYIFFRNLYFQYVAWAQRIVWLI